MIMIVIDSTHFMMIGVYDFAYWVLGWSLLLLYSQKAHGYKGLYNLDLEKLLFTCAPFKPGVSHS